MKVKFIKNYQNGKKVISIFDFSTQMGSNLEGCDDKRGSSSTGPDR